jgi:fatty-acyl-CoA synthase
MTATGSLRTIPDVHRGAVQRSAPRQGLIDWLDDPCAGAGLYFAEDDGGWAFLDYADLAELVADAAARIEELRWRSTGVVTIVMPSGPRFVATFLGALVAGHTPSPLALPLVMRDTDQYVAHAAEILDAADPALVLADDSVLSPVRQAAELAGLAHAPQSIAVERSGETPRRRPPAELALLQFTSGSSGRPRGVKVSWDNLETNIAMIRGWLGWTPQDPGATWLPLYHDMGLIGCLLTPLVSQSDLFVMRPDQFVRDPLRWLACFGESGTAFTAAPNFGFAYVAKHARDEDLAGFDFSNWRAAIVAAERLDAAVLGKFARRLAPYGFRASAFLPAYGLAEATLAVTGSPPTETPRVVRPDWPAARMSERLEIKDAGDLADVNRMGSGEGWAVGCGYPFEGVDVKIVDERGEELPDGYLGEIFVRGDIVAQGYTIEAESSTRFTGEGLYTGDAGFKYDGDLFVMGRLGDSLKVRGRAVFVEDLEARIGALDGVSKGRCVVLAGTHGVHNRLVALVEAEPGPWIYETARVLEAEVGHEAAVQVIAGPPHVIQRTSSGKPRRRVMWGELVEGELPGRIVYDSTAVRADAF